MLGHFSFTCIIAKNKCANFHPQWENENAIFFWILSVLGCYNSPPPTEDLVPRSRTIPGEGRGREARGDDLNTTNTGLDSMPMTNFDWENFCTEMATSKNETIRRSRGRATMVNDDQIEAFSLKVVRIQCKRTEVKGWPRCAPESDKLKVLQEFLTWDQNRDNTLQEKHCNESNTPHSRDPRVWRG